QTGDRLLAADGGLLVSWGWAEICRVHTRRHDVHRLANRVRIQMRERFAIGIGYREHAVETTECLPLISLHPPMLCAVQQLRKDAPLRFRMPAPDLRLDVVREDDGRARQMLGQVH